MIWVVIFTLTIEGKHCRINIERVEADHKLLIQHLCYYTDNKFNI